MSQTLAQIVDAVRSKCRLRHLSYATEDAYLFHLRKFAKAKLTYPADWSNEQKIEAFLSSMARRGLSATTQNQAFNALIFVFREVLKVGLGDIKALRAKRSPHIRHAPSRDDTRALLDAVKDVGGYPTRLITHMLYARGLRVTEPLNLRIKDVLLSESKIIIRGAKGGKDRAAAMPCSLMTLIRQQVERARAQWRMDATNKIPVPLPGCLATKYPNAPFAWQWYWLFPAHGTCRERGTGRIVRWRCHEANVQRAVKAAADKLGLGGAITPHVLRHAFATHTLKAGANIRDVQLSLGHAHLETTEGYVHQEADAVPSPLETLFA